MEKQIVSNQNFTIKVNDQKNRLYATFYGFWNEEKIMDDYMANLKKALTHLNRNFTLVADLRLFRTLPKELVNKQKKSMEILAAAGIYKVAEVLPESVIASIQLKQSATETNMPNKQFSEILSAEKWLDSEVSIFK